jgi:glutamate-5-semialdehyde dehydrogenase
MTVRAMAEAARTASQRMVGLPAAAKSAALLAVANALLADRALILEANSRDLEAARQNDVAPRLLERLAIDAKLAKVVDGVRQVAAMADPVGAVQWRRRLDDGLILSRVARPIGVLGIVFESRPDALVQIASLCLKSGNAVVMKGGSEAAHTNQQLFTTIEGALTAEPGYAGAIQLMTSREDVRQLLELDDLVDLIIPRGSNELVRSIKAATRIPVMGHADGICHVYVDGAADLPMAVEIAVDSKVETVAVCNAAETLLVHAAIAPAILPPLADRLLRDSVELRGDPRVAAIIPVTPASAADWDTEYLDRILSIAIVDSVAAAVQHINRHGSHHTDAIVTQAAATARQFMQQVDSATVLWNASTRFADGYRFGMGAEVGISTNRIHARGPVGLDGLLTYQYQVEGSGQIASDYISGDKEFDFAELAAGAPPVRTE